MSSRPREGAEMNKVWCSDYMLLLKAIGSIFDIKLFLEFFKVYLDFLNTRAHKCPAANLTQRLKKMSSESEIFRKKTLQSTTEIENCSHPTPLHPDSVQIVIIEQGK